jgi:hypothetical protein
MRLIIKDKMVPNTWAYFVFNKKYRFPAPLNNVHVQQLQFGVVPFVIVVLQLPFGLCSSSSSLPPFCTQLRPIWPRRWEEGSELAKKMGRGEDYMGQIAERRRRSIKVTNKHTLAFGKNARKKYYLYGWERRRLINAARRNSKELCCCSISALVFVFVVFAGKIICIAIFAPYEKREFVCLGYF